MVSGMRQRVDKRALQPAIDDVLSKLGRGHIDSVAYDTAWVARVAPLFPDVGFENALPWLRARQHADGSWGGEIIHHHDRFISTLAAAIALKEHGNMPDDADRVRRAEEFLWREYPRLNQDAHETIGFPVLAISLLDEARQLEMNVPHNPRCDAETIAKKLAILQYSPHLWRNHTMSFSLEAIRSAFPKRPDFLETNGSVGTSPAATAALLLRSQHRSPEALAYLRSVVMADGGVPNVSPIDTFEIAWSLNYLRIAGAVKPEDLQVRRALSELWHAWSPQSGLGFSSYYSIFDLDDTAAGYAVLRWGGYRADEKVFAQFEEESHFRCFPHEIDPSLSAQVRLISALKGVPAGSRAAAWVEKTVTMLRRSETKGEFWFDKWHASPYYLACIAVEALTGVADDMVITRLRWLYSTQNGDGGWGFYGWSTPEETAYGLLSLLFWERQRGGIDPARLHAAADFLLGHIDDERLTPLWLGKCLYTPRYVVKATLLAALHAYALWDEQQR